MVTTSGPRRYAMIKQIQQTMQTMRTTSTALAGRRSHGHVANWISSLCSVEDGCGKNMASHHFGYPYVRCLVYCVNEPKKETLQVAMRPDGKYLWYIYMKWCGWEAMMLQLSRRNCSLWKSTRPGRQFTGSTKTMTWYNGNQNLSYGVMMRMECMAYTYICKFQCWL